jgi:acyl-coenzyme A thioesterase PaaI-like protein
VDASAIAASLEQIPYTLALGIVIDHAESGQVQMTLPDTQVSQNMVGIVHAGALYTFGETVAGVAAGFDTLETAFPFARRAEIRYLRPARGAIRGSARIAPSDSKRILEELARDGRSELSVAVRLEDSAGQTVAEMDVDYAFRPRAFRPQER